MSNWINRVYIGDCRDGMRQMIADGVKVQTCVTSPPYWGLRSYLNERDSNKKHEIGLEPLHDCLRWATGNKCGECHVCHIVDVFRLVRDLLVDDGTAWLNYGDCYYTPRYNGGIGANSTINGQGSQEAYRRASRSKRAGNQIHHRDDAPNRNKRLPGLKPKDMALMPARLALALQADGWWIRSDVIWHKKNPMPESADDRPTRAHEYLFLLAKSEHYQYDADAIKEPASPNTHARLARAHGGYAAPGQDEHRGILAPRPNRNGVNPKARIPSGWDTGDGNHRKLAGRYARGTRQNESFAAATSGVVVEDRNKRSVWTLATSPYPEAHFATYPPELIEPCILASTRPGQIVLDPFIGSGTTGEVCQRLGRQWIGCELQGEYEPLQRRRTAQLGMPL